MGSDLKLNKENFTGFLSGDIPLRHSNSNEPDVIIIKVNNLSEINNNFNENCCICLEYIDPIDSFKLNECDYHLYHEECIKLYIKNNFKKCPICNI